MDLRQLDELEDDLVEIILIQELLKRCQSRLRSKKRKRASEAMPGHDYVHELLESKNHEQIYQAFCMRYGTFIALRDWLLAHTALKPTKELTVEEKLAIFLYIVTGPASNRDAQERFSHSGDTISRCFYDVLDALLILYTHFVSLPSTDTPLASQILDDDKYYPFFEDCLGSIVGAHIPVSVPARDRARYRNRTGSLSQYVFVACNFDMQFLYILAGWEGSAFNGQVLRDAQTKGFLTPKGKYWLGGAGYGCTEFVLAPYRDIKYHSEAQGQTPENSKELFNLRHATLRNAIERLLGVLRRKFKILNTATEYSATIQSRLVFALTGLANFLTIHEGIPKDELEEVDRDIQQRERESMVRPLIGLESIEMTTRRDRIAEVMWEDYCFSKSAD